MAASYRGHDLADGSADHMAGTVVGAVGREDARGFPFRERDEVRVAAVAYGEA